MSTHAQLSTRASLGIDLDQKVEEKKYRCIEDFQADAEMMVHTSVVYHGATHERTDLCQLTLNDCNYDVSTLAFKQDFLYPRDAY